MTDPTSDAGTISITAGAEPIKLGSILLTLVEPHRGHEVAYHRWYERDHFYAGCMVGPYNFAGKRFVATAPLKALRSPDSSPITGEPLRGSYIAVYYVLDGYHDVWNKWAVAQVNALHAKGRMFEARDHVHTLLYKPVLEHRREPDGVPIELALDHPYAGFVPMWIDRAEGTTHEELLAFLENEHLPKITKGTAAGLVAGFTALPLLNDAPGDVPREEASDNRLLLLWFLDEDPREAWDEVFVANEKALRDSGKATVVAAIPFIPTIPGTDTYCDELWADA